VFVAYVYVWKKGGLDWAGGSLTPIEAEAASEAPGPREEVGIRAG
jgi:hypothetical protein